MNFLIVEGFKDAAVKFASECGSCDVASTSANSSDASASSQDLLLDDASIVFIERRRRIRALLNEGKVDEAVCCINSVNPTLLDENAELFFELQQLKLIEFIRQQKIDEALEFAQQELAPLAEKNSHFLEELEKTLALLAFDLRAKENIVQLLDPTQRQRVATKVNEAMLEDAGVEKTSKLAHIFKMLSWAQKKLEEKVNFPVMKSFAMPDSCFLAEAASTSASSAVTHDEDGAQNNQSAAAAP